jgi:hypothetical protein
LEARSGTFWSLPSGDDLDDEIPDLLELLLDEVDELLVLLDELDDEPLELLLLVDDDDDDDDDDDEDTE